MSVAEPSLITEIVSQQSPPTGVVPIINSKDDGRVMQVPGVAVTTQATHVLPHRG
jgi:hypothetical protein